MKPDYCQVWKHYEKGNIKEPFKISDLSDITLYMYGEKDPGSPDRRFEVTLGNSLQNLSIPTKCLIRNIPSQPYQGSWLRHFEYVPPLESYQLFPFLSQYALVILFSRGLFLSTFDHWRSSYTPVIYYKAILLLRDLIELSVAGLNFDNWE